MVVRLTSEALPLNTGVGPNLFYDFQRYLPSDAFLQVSSVPALVRPVAPGVEQ